MGANPLQDRPQTRLLFALKSTGPQTAAALARKFAISAVAVRQQLDRLLDDGLVEYRDARLGVGRPKRIWALSPTGHDRFPDNHSGLMLQMLDSIGAVFGTDGLEKLIAHREGRAAADYAARLNGTDTPLDRLRRLAAARSEEGYMAEVTDVTATSALMVENHCPICAAARACQGFCRSELAMFQSVLGPEVRVERVEHLLAGARRCAYRVDWD
ncbi:MAG: transcriptional regulator [Rhodospirillaceae bacterium]|nr:transcriptional regulator [Rhodospirillaceae bacterium]